MWLAFASSSWRLYGWGHDTRRGWVFDYLVGRFKVVCPRRMSECGLNSRRPMDSMYLLVPAHSYVCDIITVCLIPGRAEYFRALRSRGYLVIIRQLFFCYLYVGPLFWDHENNPKFSPSGPYIMLSSSPLSHPYGRHICMKCEVHGLIIS